MIVLVTALLVFARVYSAQSRDVVFITLSQLSPEELAEIGRNSSHEFLLRTLSAADADDRRRAMNNEIVATITGNDFYQFGADGNANEENHIVVDSLILMSRKIRAVRKVYEVALNASQTTRTLAASSINLSEVVTAFCDQIDTLMRSDPSVSGLYARAKEDARRQRLGAAPRKVLYYEIPRTADQVEEIRSYLQNNRQYRLWLWNKIFFYDLMVSYPMANAVFDLAQDPRKESVVQEMYDEAVSEFLPNLEWNHIFREKSDEIFKRKLTEKFKRDDSINEELKRLIHQYKSNNSN